MKKFFLILCICLNIFHLSFGKDSDWKTHYNGRYNFSLDIPINSRAWIPENGDGLRFIDTNTVFAGAWGALGISLTDEAWAEANEDNFVQYYLEEIRRHKRTLGYHMINKNVFVISYTEGNNIIYHKALLNKRDYIIIHLEFKYPKHLKKEMDPIVERASKTLKYY